MLTLCKYFTGANSKRKNKKALNTMYSAMKINEHHLQQHFRNHEVRKFNIKKGYKEIIT